MIREIIGKSRRAENRLDARHIAPSGNFCKVDGADNEAAHGVYLALVAMARAEFAGGTVTRARASKVRGKDATVRRLNTSVEIRSTTRKFVVSDQLALARKQAEAVRQIDKAKAEAEAHAKIAAMNPANKAAMDLGLMAA